MKLDVHIEWNPTVRKWDWTIHESGGTQTKGNALDWGWTRTKRGAKSQVTAAVLELKRRQEQDERNFDETEHFEVTI